MRTADIKPGMRCVIERSHSTEMNCKVLSVELGDDTNQFKRSKVTVELEDGGVRIVDPCFLSGQPWTVGEVLKALRELSPDMLVETEGCDCEGDVGSISIRESSVLLERTKR